MLFVQEYINQQSHDPLNVPESPGKRGNLKKGKNKKIRRWKINC